MSKSLGNVLDPFEVMDTFGTDALRYYCFREVSFGQDGGVSTTTFGERYESELANDFGNLASRTLAMIVRYRDGVVPDDDVDPALATDFDGLAQEVCALLDEAEITQALERIWQRVRRLNRYVEEQAPWQLAKDEAKAAELDTALRSLAEGIRAVTVLLHPYIPETAGKLLDALGRAGPRPRPGGVRRPPRRRHRRQARAAVPQAAVIDSHTHLDSTPGDDADIVAAARAAGVTRILTIGTDAESSRRAQAAAEAHDDVWFATGHHPNSATGYTDAITDELREIAAPPALRRDRRDRPGRLPRLRAARGPGARLRRPHRPRARARQAARHPHPRRRRRHDRHARRATRRASR